MKCLSILLGSMVVSSTLAYSPPIGIPNPSSFFGWEIDRATPAWPASWTAGTPSATAGYYYVDNTEVGATNTSNTYGYPGHARATAPEGSLAAGSFIYIHAGTYTPTDSLGDRFTFNAQGTTGSPVWITGNPSVHPVFQDKIQAGEGAASDFLIFENFDMNRGSTATGRWVLQPTAGTDTVNHTLIRNCTFDGDQVSTDGNAVTIGGSNTVGRDVSNTVVYNCTMAHYGVMTRIGATDSCGVYKDYRSDHAWVLNCDISAMGADCVAGSANADETTNVSTYYYIGGNTLHESGENSIDIKATRYGVISQNICYGPYVREQGWTMVLHSGGNPAPARDFWIIFNHMYHATVGVGLTSTNGTQDVGIVGNVFNDMKDSYGETTDPQNNGFAIAAPNTHGRLYIVNNTIDDCESGFFATPNSAESTNRATIYGNIVSNMKASPTYHSSTVFSNHGASDDSWNIEDYDFAPASPVIEWSGVLISLATLQGTYGQETHCITGDPLFTNAGAGDYTLQAGSTAIGASVGSLGGFDAYAAFTAIFGTSIAVDYNGLARPIGSWDMGAFEHGGPTGDPRGYRLSLSRRR